MFFGEAMRFIPQIFTVLFLCCLVAPISALAACSCDCAPEDEVADLCSDNSCEQNASCQCRSLVLDSDGESHWEYHDSGRCKQTTKRLEEQSSSSATEQLYTQEEVQALVNDARNNPEIYDDLR